jgi:hypothetical protein
MPIEPVNPSKKTGGDGQEKYPAKPKHGPGKFDEILEKAEKAQKARSEISSMAQKTRAEPPYTGKAYSDTGPRTGSNISGPFGSTGIPKTNRDLMKNNKAGGIIKSASNRADGIAQRGKTKGRIV